MRFDPALGAEIKKTRPAVVIQNDVANRLSAITVVAAISGRVPGQLFPTQVFVPAGEGGLRTDSVVVLNQLRSVDHQRLVRRLGQIGPKTMRAVDMALAANLDLGDTD